MAEVTNLTPEEMEAYQRELKRKRDNYSHDQYIMEQGLEQGAQKKAIKIAKELKDKGIDISIIAEATGLTIEEIESL